MCHVLCQIPTVLFTRYNILQSKEFCHSCQHIKQNSTITFKTLPQWGQCVWCTWVLLMYHYMTITVWEKWIRIIFKGAVKRKIFYLILILFRSTFHMRKNSVLTKSSCSRDIQVFVTCKWDALWRHLLHTDQINLPKWGIYKAITVHVGMYNSY